MEFSIYTRGARVAFIEKKLKELGYEISHKTHLISDEFAVAVKIQDIDEAKTLCEKLGVDADNIKLSVNEI